LSGACRSFRELLERKLSGRVAQSELVVLSWHEHLLGCGACRELLEAEEALELLLASLPEPNLPPELARRVISRLRDAQRRDLAETGLDALLDLDRSETAPAHLAESVLARLRTARESATSPIGAVERSESRLEALLDLDRVVPVPEGLPSRVLAGLHSVRRDEARARRAPRFAAKHVGWMLAVAALVVASWLAWTLRSRAPAPGSTHDDEIVDGETEPGSGKRTGSTRSTGTTDTRDGDTTPGATSPEPQMLAVLDVLEQWDLLMHGDIDVLLSTLDPVELESIEEPPKTPDAPPESAPKEPREPRSKG
jgi:hypothetical protein